MAYFPPGGYFPHEPYGEYRRASEPHSSSTRSPHNSSYNMNSNGTPINKNRRQNTRVPNMQKQEKMNKKDRQKNKKSPTPKRTAKDSSWRAWRSKSREGSSNDFNSTRNSFDFTEEREAAKRPRKESPSRQIPSSSIDDEADNLLKAIHLKREEARVGKAVEEQKSVVKSLKMELEKALAALSELRTERERIREAKIRLCSAVLQDNTKVSEDEDERPVPENTNQTRASPSVPPATSTSSTFTSRPVPDPKSCSSTCSAPLNGNEARSMLDQILQQNITRETSHMANTLLSRINSGGILCFQDVAWIMNCYNQLSNHNNTASSSIGEDDSFSVAPSVVSSATTNSSVGFASSIPNMTFQPAAKPSSVPIEVIKSEKVVASSQDDPPMSQIVQENGKLGSVNASVGLSAASESTPKCVANNTNSSSISEHLVHSYEAHPGSAILDICVSNGHIFTCSQDKTAKRFSLQTLKEVRVYTGHEAMIHCLEVTNSQRGIELLITGGFDQRMIIFGVKSGCQLQNTRFSERIHCLRVAWDFVYLGLGNGEVIRYHLTGHRILDRWTMHFTRGESTSAVTAISCGKEGARKVILVGCQNGDIIVRDAESGVLLRNLEGHPLNQPLLTLSMLKSRVYSLTPRNFIVHDLVSGNILSSLPKMEYLTTASVGTNCLLISDVFGVIYIHKLENNLPSKFPSHILTNVTEEAIMAIDATESCIVVGYKNGDVNIINYPTNSYQCQYNSCEAEFENRNNLISHILDSHVSKEIRSSGVASKCGWSNCHFLFRSAQNAKIIRGHIETHI